MLKEQCIRYTALRDIAEGEELCISYGGPGTLWFEDADAQEVEEAARSIAENENGVLSASGLSNMEVD